MDGASRRRRGSADGEEVCTRAPLAMLRLMRNSLSDKAAPREFET
jgi:hypothetical protein